MPPLLLFNSRSVLCDMPKRQFDGRLFFIWIFNNCHLCNVQWAHNIYRVQIIKLITISECLFQALCHAINAALIGIVISMDGIVANVARQNMYEKWIWIFNENQANDFTFNGFQWGIFLCCRTLVNSLNTMQNKRNANTNTFRCIPKLKKRRTNYFIFPFDGAQVKPSFSHVCTARQTTAAHNVLTHWKDSHTNPPKEAKKNRLCSRHKYFIYFYFYYY